MKNPVKKIQTNKKTTTTTKKTKTSYKVAEHILNNLFDKDEYLSRLCQSSSTDKTQ